MIIYRDRRRLGGPTSPPWLEDWTGPIAGHALCHRDSEAGHLVGVAQPLLFDAPSRGWFDVDTDWQAARLGKVINHGILARSFLWADVRPVQDLREQVWMAPTILTANGERAFRVAYGPSWLPELTPEQDRAEKIARAARDALIGGGADMGIACQWAAELLCISYHIHPVVIAGLALLDDRLVPEVLGVASGLDLEVTRNGA